jgi:hypothetical protein
MQKHNNGNIYSSEILKKQPSKVFRSKKIHLNENKKSSGLVN